MKAKKLLVPVLAGMAPLVVALVVYLGTREWDTTLEFRVQDAVSKGWVWDAKFRLQNRAIRAYYQSDQPPIPFTFTNLEPGDAVLEIAAPSYVPANVKLELKRGRNRIEAPIELLGYEIPNLAKWIVMDERAGNDIKQELRPVSTAGPAVLNHPCLDLWIGAQVSVQAKNGIPVKSETKEGAERGETLFRGRIEWEWDSSPETSFRYGSTIPGGDIMANSDPFWVIDYLIVVADPRLLSAEELEDIMARAWSVPSGQLEAYLGPFATEGKLAAYSFTSWNVDGGSP